MIQQPLPVSAPQAAAPSASAAAPITSFEAQEGAPIPEQHSGTKLLVSAYIVFWVIAMVFVQLTWLRQRGLAKRVGELERALDKYEPGSEEDVESRLDKTVVKDHPRRVHD
mgnify:FL=1